MSKVLVKGLSTQAFKKAFIRGSAIIENHPQANPRPGAKESALPFFPSPAPTAFFLCSCHFPQKPLSLP